MSLGRVPDGQWPGAPAPELSLPVTLVPKAGGWTPGPTASLTHTPEQPGPPAQSPGPSVQKLLTEHPLHARPVRNCRRQSKLCAPWSGGSFHRENGSVKKNVQWEHAGGLSKGGGGGGWKKPERLLHRRQLRRGGGGGKEGHGGCAKPLILEARDGNAAKATDVSSSGDRGP